MKFVARRTTQAYNEKDMELEIDSIEELMRLINVSGHPIIIGYASGNTSSPMEYSEKYGQTIPAIEIYDDWRE